jgi:hypothetical protein
VPERDAWFVRHKSKQGVDNGVPAWTVGAVTFVAEPYPIALFVVSRHFMYPRTTQCYGSHQPKSQQALNCTELYQPYAVPLGNPLLSLAVA